MGAATRNGQTGTATRAGTRPAAANEHANDNGNGAVLIEGGPRDLRRILESLDGVMDGLDEFTQRKIRILVGELVAQARYNGATPRIGLGLEVGDQSVVVEVSGLADREAPEEVSRRDSLLSEWSRWLVHSITDGTERAGDRMRFSIRRRLEG